jgi:hypothetical protein
MCGCTENVILASNMDFHDMLENLSNSLNDAGFDIAHIGNVHELSSALDTLGIDISGLGDHQIDLLLDALHHNDMTVVDLADTAPGATTVDTSAGDLNDIPVVSKDLPDAIVVTVATGAAAGLKNAVARAVTDAYDGLITLIKGRYHKHQNRGKI